MTPAEVQAFLDTQIENCRRTNPTLWEDLPQLVGAKERVLAAIPLLPRGYLALTDSRLIPMHLASDLPGSNGSEGIPLRTIDGCSALSEGRRVRGLRFSLRSGETCDIRFSRSGSEAAAFVEALRTVTDVGNPNAAARPPSLESDLSQSEIGARIRARMKDVDSRINSLRKRASDSAKSVNRAIDHQTSRIQGLDAEIEKTKEGKKLRRLGLLVTLYEDRIRTPAGTFPLTPDVHARCDVQGMKQSVQGWVFKSDQDRREVYLHINGPGWHSVVTYNLKYNLKQPSQIIEMAYAIGEAASRSQEAIAQIRARTAEAVGRLIPILREDLGVQRDLESLASDEASARDLFAELDQIERLAYELPEGDRHTRHVLRDLISIRASVEDLLHIGQVAVDRWTSSISAWRERAESLASEPMEGADRDAAEVLPPPNLADPATTLATSPPATEKGGTPPAEDVFAQIERLGDLRTKGLITDEEFEAKKAKLLGRI